MAKFRRNGMFIEQWRPLQPAPRLYKMTKLQRSGMFIEQKVPTPTPPLRLKSKPVNSPAQ